MKYNRLELLKLMKGIYEKLIEREEEDIIPLTKEAEKAMKENPQEPKGEK